MSQPYIGEIRMVGFNFNPVNWALCNGQTLPISGYETLFNLIGTTYGGDGVSTFNLPNLQSRMPLHVGTGGGGTYVLGAIAGTDSVTLNGTQIPVHAHQATCSNVAATKTSPQNAVPAVLTGTNLWYSPSPTPNVPMAGAALPMVGGSQPHSNQQPYQVVNFIIALFGVYPSQ
jgi:microcystin-dependent protein